MIMMNSVLTAEERYVLQSLGCKDKTQALSVLGEMKMILPIRSELFTQVVCLSDKLEKEKIDLLLRAGMAAPSGKDVRPWEFVVVSDRAKLDSMAAALPSAAGRQVEICGIYVIISKTAMEAATIGTTALEISCSVTRIPSLNLMPIATNRLTPTGGVT